MPCACSVRKRLGDVEQKLARIVAELAAERIESARWKQRALQQQKTLQVRLSLAHTHIDRCTCVVYEVALFMAINFYPEILPMSCAEAYDSS